ncbi:MAG: asparaginase [Propionibacteriales bacterium]|nr:asparaginase [Propionibacteriales bacterium]
MSEPVVVAEVVRSGFVESRHHGSVVALDHDGSEAWSVGAVESTILPRSSNKPMQLVGMLRCGLDLAPELLALVASSHSAEPFHLDGVRRILAGAGLDETALPTPAAYPLEDWRRDEVVRDGVRASPLLMNCSGKHAGMLATCVVNGWDTATYRDPEHPLQVAIRTAFEELTGVGVDVVGVDGCGAPLFSSTLTGVARAFRRLALAGPDTPEGIVAAAVREFPEHVSGSRRDESQLLRALPGAICKAGAEGCHAAAFPDGRAVALKIDDGERRARPVVMAGALRRLGLEHPVLDELAESPVLGGGDPVGVVRPVLEESTSFPT